MKREIKFRAWSKELNKYSKPFTLLSEVLDFTNSEGVGVVKSLSDEIVEQYIGLKDKNGKEIYESDRLSMYNHDAGTHFEGVVVYRDSSFVLDENGEGFGEPIYKYHINYITGNIRKTPNQTNV